jgi:hypothetical protein
LAPANARICLDAWGVVTLSSLFSAASPRTNADRVATSLFPLLTFHHRTTFPACSHASQGDMLYAEYAAAPPAYSSNAMDIDSDSSAPAAAGTGESSSLSSSVVQDPVDDVLDRQEGLIVRPKDSTL